MVQKITTRNARFQQWQALLTNRTKRQRAREFLVQGVRPVTVAVERGWPVRALLHSTRRPLSRWAEELLRETRAERVAMDPALLAELGGKDGGTSGGKNGGRSGGKDESAPEIVAVVEMPEDDLGRIDASGDFLGVLFDRPTSPGNIGTVVRSADAFGADGLIVTGHAADVYDPKSVRASTGSLFALPAVRVPSHREVVAWLEKHAARGRPITVVGTDEHGDADLFDAELTGPLLLLVGNETAGLSAAWRELCDLTVRIPMSGSASSLNAAGAATAVLYEISRQRIAAERASRAAL